MATFPEGLTLRNVTGSVDPGTDVEITITEWLIGPVDDMVYRPRTLEPTPDAEGDFDIDLPVTDDPQWSPFQYRVRLQSAGKILKGVMDVPSGIGALDIADLLNPDGTVEPGASYISLGQKGAPNGVAELGSDGMVVQEQLPGVDWSEVQGKPTTFPPDVHQHTGTTQNTFDVGDNAAGVKALRLKNGFTSSLQANPSAARTWDLPDVSGMLAMLDKMPTYQPEDHNLIGWTFDPVGVFGTYVMAPAGTLHMARIRLLKPTLTNLHFHLTAGGSVLTSGQCFATVFTDANAWLGASAMTGSLHASGSNGWGDGGFKTHPLASPQNVTPYGWYKVIWWYNGTTGPTMSRAGNNGAPITNANLPAANSRYATANTGITTTPPGTLGTQTAVSPAVWVGAS